MGQNDIKVLKKEKIRKDGDGKEGIIAVREILEGGKVTGVNVSIFPQTFIEAGQSSFFITAMVSEKKWKSTYSEMKEILKNGFQELSNEKIGFDWNSVKTSSAKFISDAIRISDKNGVQKSVPVKIISSDELSGICGKECRTDLSRICGTGYCLVKSVSSKKIRWEYGLNDSYESSMYDFETDIITGNTKLAIVNQ